MMAFILHSVLNGAYAYTYMYNHFIFHRKVHLPIIWTIYRLQWIMHVGKIIIEQPTETVLYEHL